MSLLLQNRIRRNSRNRYGKRTERLISFNDGQKRKSGWVYDKYGRLTAMNDEGKTVSYTYDNQSRIAVRKADNIPVYYTYTRFGQLESKSLGSPFPLSGGSGDSKPIAYIKYFYSPDGQITARDVSGNKQDYKYDLKGQLLAVVDGSGKAVEQYVYDAAGNILSKTIDGEVTTFKYDKANQLVSSTDASGKVTHFDYDAAGRLTKEGDKSYAYGWLDKVMSVNEGGKLFASFVYGIDNQLSSRTDATGKSESFTWDGLALIKRDSTNFMNESAVTGGNPILAFGQDSTKALFEDMLGSSVGSVENGKFNAINRTIFGESSDDSKLNFFTGKPQVEGLGYAFQLRNYRADQGKWQTSDPMGYPDGWNNLAYVNNAVTMNIDWLGGWTVDAHNALLAGEFSNMSSSDIAAIQAGSTYVDRLANQGSSAAYQHSMSSSSLQSSAEAIALRDAFITQNLALADSLINSDRNAALGYLGQAMHAIQDSYCPLHVDSNGDPIAWRPCDIIGVFGHILGNEGPNDLTQAVVDNVNQVSASYLMNYSNLTRAISE